MDSTVVLETFESRGRHPSFPCGLPAIVAEPVAHGYCTDCAWLAGMIRAGRDVEQYASLALAHFDACHDRVGNYGITGGAS